MKKIVGMLAFSLLSQGVLACDCSNQAPLDKIVFQVSARQWVTTQSALLTANVNATLNNADLVKARADIMTNLGKIASGDWHLTQFDRSQDSSGLEKLFVSAQVRVPQASLTDIYQLAKDVSKPGATYTINGVDFTPSLDEVQTVKSQLREKLYQLVNEELARMNKVYTSQQYSVNNLYVIEGDNPMPVQPRAYQAKELNTMVMGATAAPALTVSNELVMSAMVEAGSNRAVKVCNAPANP
ncbi:hypothetical protein [Legionella genomosp. 1]|uniref:hypothetical protein n=1 Tax=Legionella genomosp. 1 TaxID=1093625 RepID=UPI001054D432|nr:hypothetical protein [Legionella genomosp. 1]